MNESEKIAEKRALILEKIQELSDAEILENDNFTYWHHVKAVTKSHGGTGHPNEPPPPPDPPGGGQG